MALEEKIKRLPSCPGVYFFWSRDRKPLYVGKASNLKRRVSSYFHGKPSMPGRIALMAGQIRDLDYIPAATSAEALIYEAAFIKRHQPRYNVELKDGKTYPYLELTAGEKFPFLFITRKKANPKSIYYGPYTSVKLLRKALGMMKILFPMRTCRNIPKKPCLSYSLGQCLGPCVGSSVEEYKRIVEDVKLFLNADKQKLLKRLTDRMLQASKEKKYEEALKTRNAIEAFSSIVEGSKPPLAPERDLEALKRALGLKVIPARIEAFDISDIRGKESVGSMVSFFNGAPQKDEYKRFKIKGVNKIDDYAMMREVIRRRYTGSLAEKVALPDLILIDGGIGHLNMALDELDKIGLKIPVISIAKQKEIVFTEGSKKPLELSGRTPAHKLIRRIRDEAHRFAISYHHLLRGKTAIQSALDNISGLAGSDKKNLIEYFGSVEEIKKKNIKGLIGIRGIGEKKARRIFEYFRTRH